MADYPGEDPYDALDEDGALADEDFAMEKNTANQSGVRGGKVDVLPEDSIAPSDRAEGEEIDDGTADTPAYPVNLTITITKPGAKALEIRAIAQDSTIELQNIIFFPKEALLDAQNTKEAEEARSLYIGPPAEELDAELQQMFYQYLEERGIDEELAAFLPEYMDQKEQREYVKWLEGQCLPRFPPQPLLISVGQTSRTSSKNECSSALAALNLLPLSFSRSSTFHSAFDVTKRCTIFSTKKNLFRNQERDVQIPNGSLVFTRHVQTFDLRALCT